MMAEQTRKSLPKDGGEDGPEAKKQKLCVAVPCKSEKQEEIERIVALSHVMWTIVLPTIQWDDKYLQSGDLLRLADVFFLLIPKVVKLIGGWRNYTTINTTIESLAVKTSAWMISRIAQEYRHEKSKRGFCINDFRRKYIDPMNRKNKIVDVIGAYSNTTEDALDFIEVTGSSIGLVDLDTFIQHCARGNMLQLAKHAYKARQMYVLKSKHLSLQELHRDKSLDWKCISASSALVECFRHNKGATGIGFALWIANTFHWPEQYGSDPIQWTLFNHVFSAAVESRSMVYVGFLISTNVGRLNVEGFLDKDSCVYTREHPDDIFCNTCKSGFIEAIRRIALLPEVRGHIDEGFYAACSVADMDAVVELSSVLTDRFRGSKAFFRALKTGNKSFVEYIHSTFYQDVDKEKLAKHIPNIYDDNDAEYAFWVCKRFNIKACHFKDADLNILVELVYDGKENLPQFASLLNFTYTTKTDEFTHGEVTVDATKLIKKCTENEDVPIIHHIYDKIMDRNKDARVICASELLSIVFKRGSRLVVEYACSRFSLRFEYIEFRGYSALKAAFANKDDGIGTIVMNAVFELKRKTYQ